MVGLGLTWWWFEAPRPSVQAAQQQEKKAKTGKKKTLKKRPQVAAEPLKPAPALKALHTPDDLRIEQIAAEPAVVQPVFLNFDERGRMWIVQYLQYPYPAGLKMLSRDGVWRAVYDKVPPPPPNHFKGADKITIHEDSNGDGSFDRQKTFLDGLNIVTSVAWGRGGIYVLNPPYLMFYPDKDRDDVPDGNPEVLLEGFGLEDTHSVVNSLCWGPDGWLYATQGSTVTGAVKRPGLDKEPVHSMGQLVWRYHPETRRYEVFAEGGGNAFGVTFDAKGRVFSGHNGGDTRGFAYVQGGYFQKGFNKHGPLSNPYAFGYFPAMKHNNVPRFTHTFVIYDGAALPSKYNGKLFGVAPLLNHVVLSDVKPDGSSIQTHDIGYAVTSNDPWFRPVDIKLAPDGALYVADWYDRQANHYRNHEGQIDKTNGHIYCLEAKDAKPIAPFDLAKRSTPELVELLGHSNQWFRDTALRLLGDRKDQAAIPLLMKGLRDQKDQHALESLWGLNLSGGFNDDVAVGLLDHEDPYVRLWAVRLACDKKQVSNALARALAERARTEPNVEARSQLACSARRLPAAAGLPIVRNLLEHSEDTADIHIPLLLWWAIESKAESDRAAVLALFRDPKFWDLSMVQKFITERLMRRYAATGKSADLLTCVELLKLSPSPESSKRLIAGFEAAQAGRTLPDLPEALAEALSRFGGDSLILGLRRNQPDAVQRALKVLTDKKADQGLQLQYLQVIGEVSPPTALPTLLDLACSSGDSPLRGAALAALGRYNDPTIADRILAALPSMSEELKTDALTLLAARQTWTGRLLDAIAAGRVDAQSVPADAVARIRLYRDEKIAQRARQIWGEARAVTSAQHQSEIDRFASVIRGGSGIPKPGKAIFDRECAKCHILFGKGGNVGPDLTTYQRDDLETMLLNIVNPSAEIREGFTNYLVSTNDGRTLVGTLVDQDPQIVVLRGSDGRDTVIRRSEIEEMKTTTISLMPEGLLKILKEQDVRDLFAYLRSTQPLID
jgi:putative heme-binding domain-containing protein